MTDLEISKSLALAIGWPQTYIARGDTLVVYAGGLINKVKSGSRWLIGYRIFDYRDWNVIGPIAERYNVFPYMHKADGVPDGKWVVWPSEH